MQDVFIKCKTENAERKIKGTLRVDYNNPTVANAFMRSPGLQ